MNKIILKKWNNYDTFGKVIISMVFLAIVGMTVFCFGYETVGRTVVWSAVAVDIIAAIVVGIGRLKKEG